MISLVFSTLCLLLCSPYILTATISEHDGEATVHFDFQLENGQTRDENIKYNMTSPVTDTENTVSKTEEKPIEYRGGFSFISDDGYEYTTLYKANKNGFQPYVTARKIKKINAEDIVEIAKE